MEDSSRRELLAGTGTCLAALGAGCLDDGRSVDDDSNDDRSVDDGPGPADGRDGQSTDRAPLERWVPASGSEELRVHYRDLTALETYAEELRPSVIDDVPTLPDGESAAVVEAAVSEAGTVESVLRFGSEDVAGNVVATGSFDPDALETDGESAVGGFETRERDGLSVAVTEGTLVASASDGAALETILAAGVDGTGRRVDEHERFAQLAERVGESTFLWGEYEGDADGTGVAFSWSLGADASTYTGVAVHPDADRIAEFEATMTERFDDVTVETDGTVGVARRTVPTDEFEYRDPFAERGSEPPRPQAGVTIDSDPSDRTVTVTYVSKDDADRLEISDDHGNSDELTDVAETTTFEYEPGAAGELTVVGVNGDAEAVVATYSYSF